LLLAAVPLLLLSMLLCAEVPLEAGTLLADVSKVSMLLLLLLSLPFSSSALSRPS
jgi:hypothetical protein